MNASRALAKTQLALLSVLIPSMACAQMGWLDRADSLAARFDYVRAVEAYRSADSADAYLRLDGLSTAENMLGLDLLALGKKDSAKIHFAFAIDAGEEMVRRFPDSADSHFDLSAAKGNIALLSGAKSKVRLGREVEEHALRAVELDSTHSDALSVLGVLYREVSQLNWLERLAAKTLFGGLPSGSIEKSEAYLREALSCDPGSSFAAYELGQTLISMDRSDEAREVYERLLTMKPRNGENLRDQEEARRWLERAGD